MVLSATGTRATTRGGCRDVRKTERTRGGGRGEKDSRNSGLNGRELVPFLNKAYIIRSFSQ